VPEEDDEEKGAGSEGDFEGPGEEKGAEEGGGEDEGDLAEFLRGGHEDDLAGGGEDEEEDEMHGAGADARGELGERGVGQEAEDGDGGDDGRGLGEVVLIAEDRPENQCGGEEEEGQSEERRFVKWTRSANARVGRGR